MTTGTRMKLRRKELDIPVDEVAKALDVSIATIYRYEKGDIEKLPGNVLEPLAAVLRTTPAYLMGWEDPDNAKDAKATAGSSVRISVLGSVPAGVPIEAIEDVIDWEDIPAAMTRGGKEYFALRVSGDSMYPKYLDWDIVIVHKTPTCDSGDDCVVYVNGYDATLKTVVLGEDGSVTLRPININYAPRTFSPTEVAELPVSIAGVVAELRRKVKV